MTTRKLNSDEVKMSRTGIARLNNRNNRLSFFVKRSNLDMDKLILDKENAGLIYDIKIEELQKSIDELNKELKENEDTIKTLNTHIKEGVEEKHTQ